MIYFHGRLTTTLTVTETKSQLTLSYMRNKTFAFLALVSTYAILNVSCKNNDVEHKEPDKTNAVYYWRTTLETDSTELRYSAG